MHEFILGNLKRTLIKKIEEEEKKEGKNGGRRKESGGKNKIERLDSGGAHL